MGKHETLNHVSIIQLILEVSGRGAEKTVDKRLMTLVLLHACKQLLFLLVVEFIYGKMCIRAITPSLHLL